MATASVLAVCQFSSPIPVTAQIAPTQVNQKATDEFGFDRKTGRVSWNSGEIIRIGGENGLGITIDETGEISAAHVPRIKSSGGSAPSEWYRTISYFADSQTFVGSSSYTSEYPVGSSLVNVPNGFLFTDKHGVTIEFNGLYNSKTVYPDGREIIYEAGKFQKTNFGYMFKFGFPIQGQPPATTQAVNQSVDYCLASSDTLCAGLTQLRTAAFGTARFGGAWTITDAQGHQTALRSTLIQAKMYRQTSFYIPPDEYVSYLVGVTRPGSQSEDLTITYKSINPTFETHDDIWATAIRKDGITTNYAVTKTQLGGQGVPVPSTSYSLTISASVNGQKLWDSFAVKPTTGLGRSRRVLAYIADPLGRRTGFTYNAAVEVSSVMSPSGLATVNEYDARNNIVRSIVRPPTGTGPDLVTTYTYAASCTVATQATCNKPLTITDPKGNVTEFTYNSRGQVLTQTLAAPTAGAPRPQTRFTYTMRTAFIKDASGLPVAAGQPISLLTRTSSCRTQSTCAGTNDEVITNYDYGPTSGLNNLDLRGIAITAANELGQMVTNRTCYRYNYFGEKIAETQPAAGLTSCP